MARTDTTAAHVARIAEQGYTIVEEAIEADLVTELQRAVQELERSLDVQPAANPFEGDKTLRIYNLLALGTVFEQVPVHPGVLPIVEGVLDPGCLISSLSSIHILGGETPQPIHADDQLIPLPKPHPPTVCNSMWALADHDPDLLGSYDTVAAEMPAGSVLIWHGSLWHGGGANRTEAPRLGLAMNYCAGFVRQQENQQLGIPRELVKGFGPRLRELVGYSVYHGLIGHIDKRNPSFLLDEDGDHRMIWDV